MLKALQLLKPIMAYRCVPLFSQKLNLHSPTPRQSADHVHPVLSTYVPTFKLHFVLFIADSCHFCYGATEYSLENSVVCSFRPRSSVD